MSSFFEEGARSLSPADALPIPITAAVGFPLLVAPPDPLSRFAYFIEVRPVAATKALLVHLAACDLALPVDGRSFANHKAACDPIALVVPHVADTVQIGLEGPVSQRPASAARVVGPHGNFLKYRKAPSPDLAARRNVRVLQPHGFQLPLDQAIQYSFFMHGSPP
jgi:hypothetical protein